MIRNTKSWGNYPQPGQKVYSVKNKSDLTKFIKESLNQEMLTLAVGNGRSYGDSYLAQSGRAVRLSGLNQILSANWEEGVIVVQAGALFSDLLPIIVPNGWFFAVTPGSKFVTIGGAIANDVHGKNHHTQGTFGSCVSRLCLYRSNGDIIECSKDENSDLFAATISGLGLTGVILWAEINLKAVASNAIDTCKKKFETLEEFVEVSTQLEKDFEYVLAWIDYKSKDSNFCRGVVFAGRHAEHDVKIPSARKFSIPLTPFISLVNNLSTRLFNELYFRTHSRKDGVETVHYDKFFYPLDNIHRWNRIYGRKGFQQYQCVIPHIAAIPTIKAILGLINQAGTGSFLSALKIFGDNQSPGLNSFPMKGISLAIDFPQSYKLDALFLKLDSLVHKAGGRLYPAKDAHMAGVDFRNSYPHWKTLDQLRDPVLMSRFWHKVQSER